MNKMRLKMTSLLLSLLLLLPIAPASAEETSVSVFVGTDRHAKYETIVVEETEPEEASTAPDPAEKEPEAGPVEETSEEGAFRSKILVGLR